MRPDAAVDADDIGTVRVELGRELLGRDPFEGVAVLFERHRRDDRKLRDVANPLDRRANLGKIGERLEDEQVDPAGFERSGLCAERLARLLDRGRTPGLDPDPERADRSRDVAIRARDLAGEGGPLLVDLPELAFEAVVAELV